MAKKQELPIESRPFMSLSEASVYFCINTHKLREMANDPDCDFAFRNGRKLMFNREALTQYLKTVRKI